MNNKVFGTINAATWATGDEIGRQFDVLNNISRGKESSVIDVCDLCKSGSVELSPDSIINVEEGCRCKAKEAPNLTTGGGIVDVADMANGGLGSQQLREDIINEEINKNNNYIIDSAPSNDAPSNDVQTNEQETNDSATNDAPTNDSQTNEQATNDTPTKSEIQVVGVDDGAVEKFCSGHMSSIEYSINIAIIILFISISVMAIMTIFKLSIKCCNTSLKNKTTLTGGNSLYLRPTPRIRPKPSIGNSYSKPVYSKPSISDSYSKPSISDSYSKPSIGSNSSRLTGDIF